MQPQDFIELNLNGDIENMSVQEIIEVTTRARDQTRYMTFIPGRKGEKILLRNSTARMVDGQLVVNLLSLDNAPRTKGPFPDKFIPIIEGCNPLNSRGYSDLAKLTIGESVSLPFLDESIDLPYLDEIDWETTYPVKARFLVHRGGNIRVPIYAIGKRKWSTGDGLWYSERAIHTPNGLIARDAHTSVEIKQFKPKGIKGLDYLVLE